MKDLEKAQPGDQVSEFEGIGDDLTELELGQGEKLLSAVEMLLSDSGDIIAWVDRLKAEVDDEDSDADVCEATAQRIIRSYATNSAISGGVSALPSIVPGAGTMVALTAGVLTDVALLLRFEVEMTLALAYLQGFDIRERNEREVVFLLAGLSTYEEMDEGFGAVAQSVGLAVWNYAPRRVAKNTASIMAKIAIVSASKQAWKALPLVSVVVGAGMNNVLTAKVGERALRKFQARRAAADASAERIFAARIKEVG